MSLLRDFNTGSETSQENEKDFPEEMEEMGTVKPTAICPQIRCPHRLPLSNQPPSLAWQDSPWLGGSLPMGSWNSFYSRSKVFHVSTTGAYIRLVYFPAEAFI